MDDTDVGGVDGAVGWCGGLVRQCGWRIGVGCVGYG